MASLDLFIKITLPENFHRPLAQIQILKNSVHPHLGYTAVEGPQRQSRITFRGVAIFEVSRVSKHLTLLAKPHNDDMLKVMNSVLSALGTDRQIEGDYLIIAPSTRLILQ